MMESCNDLKYQITEKLAVGLALLNPHPMRSLYNSALVVEHPALSAQDLAALAAYTVVEAFQKNLDERQVHARIAQAVCDGDGVPSDGVLPLDCEFIVGIEYASFDIWVGDKTIQIPRIKLTAYRPMWVDGIAYPPNENHMQKQCRGCLELTISHGMVLVTENKGWLGSNEIVAYLRSAFDAAVER